MQSLKSVRSERGILAAAGIAFVVFLIIVVMRPTPVGHSELPDVSTAQSIENDISARFVTSTTDPLSGASSRELETPEQTTTTLPFTNFEVATSDQWYAAVAAVQPGDVITIVATINQDLQYRGTRSGPDRQLGLDGTAERPITITSAPDAWIDPGNMNNRKPALDVAHTAHVNVVGLKVRNSQFGIRIQDSIGTAESPMLIANSIVTDIGHAGIHVIGHADTRQPSEHVRVEANTVTRTGLTAPEFGEGIYLGYGSQEWVDRSTNLTVVGNEVSFTTAEAIDVKPGVRNTLIEGNLIHDLSPLRGGAISAYYVDNAPNPNPGESVNLIVRNNRIWNVNLDNRPGSNDWAIWVGHGGVTIDGNAIWSLRDAPNEARAIRIRALYDFGPHPIVITNNVFWTATGWLAEGSPSGAGLVQAAGNRGPEGAAGIELALTGGSFPPLGQNSPADSGYGPGSVFGFGVPTPLDFFPS